MRMYFNFQYFLYSHLSGLMCSFDADKLLFSLHVTLVQGPGHHIRSSWFEEGSLGWISEVLTP